MTDVGINCIGSDDGMHCGHWEEYGDCCDCEEVVPINPDDCNCDLERRRECTCKCSECKE